jgi:hypothetical protein
VSEVGIDEFRGGEIPGEEQDREENQIEKKADSATAEKTIPKSLHERMRAASA